MNEELGFILALGVAIALMCAGVIWWESYSCESTAQRMGMESSYGPAQGCMVKTKNGWRLLSSMREVP